MKFICVQPAIDYYTWQVEVVINNFMKNGVNPNDIEIVCAHYGTISDKWKKLAEHYNYVRFFFYKDERPGKHYISSVRPHILHQHWLRYPELEQETVFYHDCDIILSKPADFQDLLNDDICYVSDTVSYIGANYIRSKGEKYLDLMTGLVGIDKDYVISQEKDSGGAQYILKNIPAEFWEKVYTDSESLYYNVNRMIADDKPAHAIQIWCADMWAVLWNLWVFGKETQVTSLMSFSWGTSNIQQWDKHPIYHNAGVVNDAAKLFFKGKYQRDLPYNINIEDYNKDFCSIKYVEEILKTKEVSCLL
jgi:hypothetical protein